MMGSIDLSIHEKYMHTSLMPEILGPGDQVHQYTPIESIYGKVRGTAR